MEVLYVLVISMWGLTGEGDWQYIGNQYVYNTPMTQEQCENIANRGSWSHHITNEYYKVQLDCMPESSELK